MPKGESALSLVKVKTKYQVTLPTALREQIGVGVGDLLEAKVEKGKITFTPSLSLTVRLLKVWRICGRVELTDPTARLARCSVLCTR